MNMDYIICFEDVSSIDEDGIKFTVYGEYGEELYNWIEQKNLVGNVSFRRVSKNDIEIKQYYNDKEIAYIYHYSNNTLYNGWWPSDTDQDFVWEAKTKQILATDKYIFEKRLRAFGYNSYGIYVLDTENSKMEKLLDVRGAIRLLDAKDDRLLFWFSGTIDYFSDERIPGEGLEPGYYLLQITDVQTCKYTLTRYEGNYLEYSTNLLEAGDNQFNRAQIIGKIRDKDIIISLLGKDMYYYLQHLDYSMNDLGTPIFFRDYYRTSAKYNFLYENANVYDSVSSKNRDNVCKVTDLDNNVLFEGYGIPFRCYSPYNDIAIFLSPVEDKSDVLYFDDDLKMHRIVINFK